MKKLIVVAALLLGACGPAVVSLEDAGQVRPGMTMQEVADLTGYPEVEPQYAEQTVNSGGRFDSYGWKTEADGLLVVGFRNGVVAQANLQL
jgi:hypothetical protein